MKFYRIIFFIKLTALAFLFLSIFHVPAVKAVDVSGFITENKEWSGDIHVTGDVVVDNGVTLTILAGTTVRFNAGNKTVHLMPWPQDVGENCWLLDKG